jgi:hypothetical protein
MTKASRRTAPARCSIIFLSGSIVTSRRWLNPRREGFKDCGQFGLRPVRGVGQLHRVFEINKDVHGILDYSAVTIFEMLQAHFVGVFHVRRHETREEMVRRFLDFGIVGKRRDVIETFSFEACVEAVPGDLVAP